MIEPLRPHDLDNALARALAFHQQGQLAQAEALYRAILERAPKHFDALHLLGVIAFQVRRFEAAVQLIGQAVQLNPGHAPAHSNLGNALRGLGRHADALACYDRALAIAPDYAEALNNRGNALGGLDRREEALASYDRALAVKPDYTDALNNRGSALRGLERHEEALASFERALATSPDHAEALNNRGAALFELRRHDEALASYEQALAVKPDYAEALNNRGTVLRALKRPDDALASYDRALALRPEDADTLRNRATTLLDLNRHEEACRSFERLLSLDPTAEYIGGEILFWRLYHCDWRDYDKNVGAIIDAVAAGRRVIVPFAFLAVSDSPGAQLKCARIYSRDKYAATERPLWRGERYAHDRIRVAYLSADFHDHPTAQLLVELFETHDDSRFETTAISFGPPRQGELRTRLEGAFTRFIDARNQRDQEVALLLNALEIDIAVDLKGYTAGQRPGILVRRPAPVQVNYLGFAGTMGADHIDYIFADRFVIPEHRHCDYAEKVVYLPDTYYPTASAQGIGVHVPTRAEAGLPETGFVFCSFNNNYKIAPPIFDIWMRLLHQIEGSVLWLLGDSPAAMRNLRQNAAARGVAAERLVFAPRAKLADHLARHRLADVMLDTLPYNAHTTATDALWAGLPVVTCPGSSFAARVAGSVLSAVGLPELIAATLEAYEALALKLAREPTTLAAIKAKLARNRAIYPLFDADRYRRHIESAYETMWQRSQCREPPAGFTVAPCQGRDSGGSPGSS